MVTPASPPVKTQRTMNVAILLAYDGQQFNGLERNRGQGAETSAAGDELAMQQQQQQQQQQMQSIEQVLFKCFPRPKTLSISHISRASLTPEGEHAAKQVISLQLTMLVPAAAASNTTTADSTEILGEEDPSLDKDLPLVEDMNAMLPKEIRVFKVQIVHPDFSARRSCDARTVEYCIPTYAFAAPPALTCYSNNSASQPGQASSSSASGQQFDYPPSRPSLDEDMPKGGLFKTGVGLGNGGRGGKTNNSSLERRPTFIRRNHRDIDRTEGQDEEEEGNDVNADQVLRQNSQMNSRQRRASYPGNQDKKSGFAKFFSKISSIFKPKSTVTSQKKKNGSQLLKQQISTNAHALLEMQGPPIEEPLVATLKRSLSLKRTRSIKEVMDQDIREREREVETGFEPLDIPAPSAAEADHIKAYRMPPQQYSNVVSTLALFNGTHNFHNYIPGSVQDDSRCFVNVYNIEAAPLVVHNGMEWLRIKVQASAFARDQIRKMMAMLILVTRTNTPRSVLGNSFGFSKIDIPEAPAGFQILDEPHYNNYNAATAAAASSNMRDSTLQLRSLIRFSNVDKQVQAFRSSLHTRIFTQESVNLQFEAWLRQLDNYSFMYTHFLNERGLIGKPRNFPKEHKEMEVEIASHVNSIAAAAE